MIILVIGGSKSGKSSYAQKVTKVIAEDKDKLIYLATMKASDLEDVKRIEKHIEDREEYNFQTIEKDKNILDILDYVKEEDTLLLESITSLMTNIMFTKEGIVNEVSEKIVNDIIKLKSKLKNIVLVSDYVFSDGIIYDEYTEKFREELGKINIEMAKISDVVIECSSGNIICHKGREALSKINDEIY